MHGERAREDGRDVGEVEKVQKVEVRSDASRVPVERNGDQTVRLEHHSAFDSRIVRTTRALVGHQQPNLPIGGER
jgi:hypothetical protein